MLIIIITPDIFPACFLLDKLRDNVCVCAHLHGVLCVHAPCGAVRCGAVRYNAGRFVDLIRPTCAGGALTESRAQSLMRLFVCVWSHCCTDRLTRLSLTQDTGQSC